ncbi:MAG TPA: hypothetical protein VN372_07250 [Methanospirillum sp.]|nr:hypothetical protein [Methanospirillum sp.]
MLPYILCITLISFNFGRKKEERKKIEKLEWSVPIPPDLLGQLREFSPLSISRTSGIYLDDVFDILKGNRSRSSPELVEKLQETVEKLLIAEEALNREAAKIGFMIKGFDMIDQIEHKKIDEPKKQIPEKTG